MPFTAGTPIGPYKIREQMGAGGMREVYSATDTVPVWTLPKENDRVCR